MRAYVSSARRRLALARERLRLALADGDGPLAPDAALRDLPPDGRVIFLCLGNICRSPLAERYAASRLAAADADLDVDSAGFVEREDRPSPDLAVEAAAEHGVDLSDHRSAHVSAVDLADADLVFVMDAYNYLRLRADYPEVADRAYFLGAVGDEAGATVRPSALVGGAGYEISDPVNSDRGTFRRVYGEVADAVDRALARAGVVEP